MRLIDKYILKRFLTSFVFVVLIIMAVIVIIDITEKIDDFNIDRVVVQPEVPH